MLLIILNDNKLNNRSYGSVYWMIRNKTIHDMAESLCWMIIKEITDSVDHYVR